MRPVHCRIARFLYRMDHYCSFYHRTCIQYRSNLRNHQPRAVIKKKNGRSKRELDRSLILDGQHFDFIPLSHLFDRSSARMGKGFLSLSLYLSVSMNSGLNCCNIKEQKGEQSSTHQVRMRRIRKAIPVRFIEIFRMFFQMRYEWNSSILVTMLLQGTRQYY